MLRFIYILLVSLCSLSLAWADGSQYASRSALASGKWVKIQVGKTGIYKLSFDELKKMGFSDPSKVSVHGYGGWPLEEDFSKPYVDDVPATAVWKGSNYLLFYAKGPVKWTYDTENKEFIHVNNPYASYGCYFLTEGEGPKEMTTASSVAGASLKITSFEDSVIWEKDLVSVNESGRELFGESFEVERSRSFPFQVQGITGEEAKVTLRFISKAIGGGGTMSLSIDGRKIIDANVAQGDVNDSYTKAYRRQVTDAWIGDKSENFKVNLAYGQTGHKNVYLDYMRMQVKRTLKPYGAYTFFRSVASIGNPSRFVITNATANTKVLDVTDGLRPKVMEATLSGSELSFSIAAGDLREFVIVQTDQNFPSPTVVNKEVTSNLHGMPQTDMIIISSPAFRSQAERLAEDHRNRDGLTVAVINPEDIYNEFSSGTPDATAYRRFMKMLYDRSSSETDAPKYLLLFGDGVYDNRALTVAVKPVYTPNMLLTYQSQESLDIESYVTDDYYGFLEDASGKNILNDKLKIGIGRFPVRTLAEATQMVDKAIAYMDNAQVGAWKNNVAFVADDGSSADSYTNIHMSQADDEAEYIETNHPEFMVNKVFFDAYKKDYSGGRTTYPDVQKKIGELLKSGLLLLNYTGHGNTEYWSDEMVWSQSDIMQSAYPHLPLWVTATCDFSRFDSPKTSAGESVFLNKTSAGIALYSTTRAVYPAPNFIINKQLLANLFEKKDGRRLTLGEVIKNSKCSIVEDNMGRDANLYKLNFMLIGDPAMKLTYPEYRMKITTVNGKPVTDDEPVSFKAQAKMTIEGQVLSPDGNLASDFTGGLSTTVLDSKSTVKTLNNNNTGNPFTFSDYRNTIFVGNDSVRNGTFSFSFTMPTDISYSNLAGKLNLYASDDKAGNEAQGTFLNFIVGGTADEGGTDTDGPEIRALYLNDSTFMNGGKVNTTPFFVAHLWDQSGVNISGGSIGHDMMLIIDNQPSLSYNLNGYYRSVPGKEGEGLVKFSLPALSPGLHTATFKVWDVLNTSSEQTFTFEVVEGLKPNIVELTATPNPAREQVEFHLTHNRPESNLKVGILVYDMTGRLLWKHEESGSSDLFSDYVVTWNLTSSGGVRLRPGVYLYRAAIRSNNSAEASKTKKLIVLGQ